MKHVVRHEHVGPEGSRDRLRIAHLSDFHLWFSARKLEEIERTIARWGPDVLALTGDYADTPRGQRLALAWMTRMGRDYPVCWVGGNHDQWWGNRFLEKLSACGEVHAIEVRDAEIRTTSGRHYRFTSLARLTKSSRPRQDGPTIVLLHDPTVLTPEQLQSSPDTLILAGHLHGGQIVLWRDRRGWPQPVASFYRWQIERDKMGPATLIVSRGLGETIPLRLGAAREVVMIDFWA
jgi:uncharacterized protein